MNLGNLKVTLGAETGQFDAALASSQERLKKFGAGSRRVINTVGKFAPVMAAASAAIVAKFTAAQFKAIDANAKLAKSLSTTTGSIATMERAGELAGVSLSGIEQATKDLTRRLSQAAEGTGPAADELDRLGLSAQGLMRLPLDQRVATINSAINEFVPAAERAAAAGRLFGEEGSIAAQRLDPATIAQAAKEAEAFGLAVSDVDAASIERANDSMSTINNVLKGVFRRIAVQVAPIVEHLATLFRDTAIETSGFQEQLGTAMSFSEKAIGFVADAINGIRVGFQGAIVIGNTFNAAMMTVAERIASAFASVLGEITTRLRGMAELINRMPGVDIDTSGLDSFDSRIESMKGQFQDWRATATEAASAAMDKFHEMAMQEVPSERIQQFFEDAREASRAASEQIIRDRQAMLGLEGGEGDEGGSEEMKALQEQQERRLEQLRESLLTEREAEMEHHQQRMEMLKTAFENELMTEQEINELKEREEMRHRSKMTEIAAQGSKDMADQTLKQGHREMQQRQQQMQALQTGVSNILGSMAQENKAFGVAQAIVNTWRGVSESLAAYPMPVAGVMAAASLAAGLQTVRSIQSSSPSGGGAGGGSINSGSAAGQAQQAQQGQQQQGGQQQDRTATVNLSGDVFSRDGVRGLMDQMNELMADGYTGVTVA